MKSSSNGLSRADGLAVVLLLAGFLLPYAQISKTRRLRAAPVDPGRQTNAAAFDTQKKSQGAGLGAWIASAKARKNDYADAGFDKLAGFNAIVTYEVVDADKPGFYYAPRLTTPIPDAVKALDGRKVEVTGFMLPLRQEQGLVTEFILLRNQSLCCFGRPPKINEWVHVRMKDGGVKTVMDQPVTISGKLQVAQYKENKTLLGIYQMDGEKMTGPQ